MHKWRLWNRLLKAAYERLEPCVGKLTSTVLMGLGFSNEPWLPDHPQGSRLFCGLHSKIITRQKPRVDCKTQGKSLFSSGIFCRTFPISYRPFFLPFLYFCSISVLFDARIWVRCDNLRLTFSILARAKVTSASRSAISYSISLLMCNSC